MGTKRNPGRFDCYAHAEPDEPMFVLLGRDPIAPLIVTMWRAVRMEMKGMNPHDSRELKNMEARECAISLEAWCRDHGKWDEKVYDAWKTVILRGAESFNPPRKRGWLSRLIGLGLALIGITVLGCSDEAACKKACEPNPVLKVGSGECECFVPGAPPKPMDPPYLNEHEKFCRSCSVSCGAIGMKTCKFGNDTWGAGPDICECGKPDAGT